ncbi:MAG: hypothetical protein V4543_11590 [Bacteroidota bacterium]
MKSINLFNTAGRAALVLLTCMSCNLKSHAADNAPSAKPASGSGKVKGPIPFDSGKCFRAQVYGNALNSFRVAIAAGPGQVDMRILDSNGETVYEESIEDAHLHLKRYNLSRLPAGKYRFEFKSGPDIIVKQVEL